MRTTGRKIALRLPVPLAVPLQKLYGSASSISGPDSSSAALDSMRDTVSTTTKCGNGFARNPVNQRGTRMLHADEAMIRSDLRAADGGIRPVETL
jgi:hypothetical protein